MAALFQRRPRTPSTSPYNPPQAMTSRFSYRGILLVIAIIALGGAMLSGFFYARRSMKPPLPLPAQAPAELRQVQTPATTRGHSEPR
ncbi:MAG TPA: hypothetical protein VIL86_01760 [Tepidisphaeraceae bacterium]